MKRRTSAIRFIVRLFILFLGLLLLESIQWDYGGKDPFHENNIHIDKTTFIISINNNDQIRSLREFIGVSFIFLVH